MTPLLSVRNLTADFRTREGRVRAVNGVSLSLDSGRVLALVGESGSGKTSTGLAIARLLPQPGRIVAGEVLFDGHNLLELDPEAMRRLRGNAISMVFQDPISGLNPVLSVGDQVAEIITSHQPVAKKEALAQAVQLMARVGLPDADRLARAYPFQLSGGMAQRVMIAIAMALNPKLLIADEPTSSLDVTVQAQILDQIERLRRETGAAVLLITHDLGVVAQIADEVAVMYAGYVVEATDTITAFRRAAHPYTAALLQARPRVDDIGRALRPIPGNPPSLVDLPDRCPYLGRCTRALNQCRTEPMPPLREIEPGHAVACYNPIRHDW